MKAIVKYDKYNTNFEKAEMVFGEEPSQKTITFEVVEETTEEEIEGEMVSTTVRRVKISAKDDLNEVEVDAEQEDMRQILDILRNTIKQL